MRAELLEEVRGPMTQRPLRAVGPLALAAALVVSAWPAPAAALHPAPFPHKHFDRRAGPPPPPAQQPRREPDPPPNYPQLYFALGGVGNLLIEDASGPSDGLGFGGGFELFFGYRFNAYAAIDLGWMSTFHGTTRTGRPGAMVAALHGDVRIFLIPWASRLDPYVQVGLGLYLINQHNSSAEAPTGIGFQGGLGLDFHLNPVVTLGIKALYRGAFNEGRTVDSIQEGFMHMFTPSAHVRLNF